MAIDASKFTEKDELIAKFYTLRAGLSVIAEETGKIKQAERELLNLNTKNEAHNKKVEDDLISESQSLQTDIDRIRYSPKDFPTASSLIQDRIYEYQRKLEKIQEHKAPISIIVILSAIIPLAILWTISGLTFDLVYESNFGLTINYLLLPAGVISAFIVGSKVRKIFTNKQRAAMTLPVLESIRQEEIKLKDAKDLEERAIATLMSEISALEVSAKSKTDIYKGEIETFENKLKTEIIPVCTSIAQATKKAMLETSLGVITEADWANIDLLIFYLETGRADSLKEALQLVDKQRQTEQITYAIHEASQHITNTLSARLNNLGTIIQTGFAQLGRQIQYNHNEAMNTMLTSFGNLEETISSGNREISQQLGNLNETMKAEGRKIADAEHLNASLLKKANESSDQLMYELRYNQKYWKK